MTPQQIDTMKLALEALECALSDDRPYIVQCKEAITAIKEALADHAMCETQRLGQEIEQCQCTECQIKPHASDCAVHSEPAYPKGKCDCGVQPEQEPVAHPVIAGALFDFMGWLTTRKERIVLSSADEASPAVDAIRDFAKMRGLSLDDAKVQDWDTAPPQRTWVGLNEDEIDYLIHLAYTGDEEFVQTIEAKLKEKNLPCIKPKWIGLTEKEHTDIAVECGCMSADWVFYGAAVERKLKERNT